MNNIARVGENALVLLILGGMGYMIYIKLKGGDTPTLDKLKGLFGGKK